MLLLRRGCGCRTAEFAEEGVQAAEGAVEG